MPRSPRPEVVALLRACKELPDEDVHRLVLADWLEENADDPAEIALRDLIRLQVEFDSLSGDDDKRMPLASQAAQLLHKHQRSWLGSLDTDRVNWGLQHGLFVMTVHEEDLSAGRLGTPGFPEGWAWVERLTVLCTQASDLAAMARAAPLGQIGTLDLRRNNIGVSGARALAESPLLANLCGLVLSHTALGWDGLETVLESPYLRGLNRLELDCNALGVGSPAVGAIVMGALAAWPSLPRLTRLSLSQNAIMDSGLAVLLGDAKARKLRELHLRACGLKPPAVKILASADLPDLRELDLSDNQLLDAGSLRDLLEAKWFGGIERLGLRRAAVSGPDMVNLRRCPELGRPGLQVTY